MNYPLAIRMLRAFRGVSKQELSILAGVDPSTIHLIENGKRNPSFRMLGKLGAVLELSPSSITLMATPVDQMTDADKEAVESLAIKLMQSWEMVR